MKNLGIVLACFAVLLAAGCSSSDDSGSTEKNKAAEAPVTGQAGSTPTGATPTTSDQELTLNPNAEHVTPGSKLGGN